MFTNLYFILYVQLYRLLIAIWPGGPTLVTDQVLSGNLATKGWLVLPELNRVAVFDGRYLHGVIPGRDVPRGAPAIAGTSPRRITLMVAFWRQKVWEPVQHPGPCQHFPYDLLPAEGGERSGEEEGSAASAVGGQGSDDALPASASASAAEVGAGADGGEVAAAAAAAAAPSASASASELPLTWPLHFGKCEHDAARTDPRWSSKPVAPHPVSTVWERIDGATDEDGALPDYDRCFQGCCSSG